MRMSPVLAAILGTMFCSQVVPCIAVAEEFGDVDQDLVEEDAELFGVDLEVVMVGAEIVDPQLGASLGNAAHETGAFVAGEIEPARVAQVLEQALEVGAG